MRISLLAIVLFFTLTIVAQTEETPIITFENLTYDYGTIERNSHGLAEIKFSNTGNSPLIINQVRASCGCTVPSWPKEPIMPGDTGVIEVKYDTRRLGVINRQITINSNAEEPNIVIRLRGSVVDTLDDKAPEKPVDRNGMPVSN